MENTKLDGTGQKHTNQKKFIVIELTDEEMLFKISDNLGLDLAGSMLYGCMEYLINLQGLYEDADKTVLQ
jgi:hypothetical protein